MLPPATWYPDPSGRHEHRYWDGERWTEHVADAGIADVDPLTAVTADEQVDGGVAADIAAVAMASTSTVGDGGPDRPAAADGDGRSAWAPAPDRADGVDRQVLDDRAATSEDDDLADLADLVEDHVAEDVLGADAGFVDTWAPDEGLVGNGARLEQVAATPSDAPDAAPEAGTGPWDPDADGGPSADGHVDADDDVDADDAVDADDDVLTEQPDATRDAWAAASAVFVMPPDTVADLRRSLHHTEAAVAAPQPIARPSFTGVDDAVVEHNIAGGLGHRGSTLHLLLDGDTDALVAPAAMRRIDGSVELSPTSSAWADHLTGTGTVELAGSSDVVVVGLAGTQRATFAIEAMLALDAAGTIEVAMVDGAWEWALAAVEGASWMALVAGDEPTTVEVTSDAGPVTVPQHDVVGWTDGLTVTVEDDDLTAEGDGHLLVSGSTD